MTKVFLLCSGLGRINRGFESFTQECFDALAGSPELDLTLFKGGGLPGPKQVVVPNLPRTNPLALTLGTLTRKSGYWVEQVTFTLSLLPHIARQKPDVLYFSDTNVGNLLWHWRRLTKQTFALLFSNGGPMQPPYPRWDFVQQVAPTHLEAARATGQPDEKQTLLPYGIRMEPELALLPAADLAELRRSLGLPTDRAVVLTVGAVNKGHKRMDYVVREVAALPVPRPYLVLLGQTDEETPEVRALADKLLGSDGYQIRTVPHGAIAGYYRAADVFVLASLNEGFGRVFLEALSWGLPCLAHDYPLTRFVLGSPTGLADFTQADSLTALLCEVLQDRCDLAGQYTRHQTTFERFSWQHLGPRYAQMITHCAGLPRTS